MISWTTKEDPWSICERKWTSNHIFCDSVTSFRLMLHRFLLSLASMNTERENLQFCGSLENVLEADFSIVNQRFCLGVDDVNTNLPFLNEKSTYHRADEAVGERDYHSLGLKNHRVAEYPS